MSAAMQFTYYGHSCFAVVVDGVRLLFDPFITGNPKAGSIDVNSIEADYILITHGHGDHLADAVAIADRTGAMVISNYEIASWLAKQGVSKTHGMNFGGSYALPFGRAKYVVAVHSSTLPDGSPGGNPGGFVVTNGTRTFYYAGDTALTYDMKLIAAEFSVDFAVLPIGDTFTMGPEDAARAAGFVGTSKVVGVHFDTFPPIAINHDTARSHFQELGVELVLPVIGETLAL
jgi:L-ascorbate metabolism protein UlaG (beta-lactamase superfamily)